jgi:hypothetical protein
MIELSNIHLESQIKFKYALLFSKLHAYNQIREDKYKINGNF